MNFVLDHTFVRFILVGAVNSLSGLSVIYIAKYLFSADDVSANLVGYGVGIIFSFFLNRKWTFCHHEFVISAFARFLVIFLIAYTANLLTLLFSTNILKINAYLAQAVSILPYTLVGYFGSKYYAFRKND